MIPDLPSRGLPREEQLLAIVKKALAPAREDRYPSAQAMLRELEQYVAESKLIASSINFGEWLLERYGEDVLQQRRARALAEVRAPLLATRLRSSRPPLSTPPLERPPFPRSEPRGRGRARARVRLGPCHQARHFAHHPRVDALGGGLGDRRGALFICLAQLTRRSLLGVASRRRGTGAARAAHSRTRCPTNCASGWCPARGCSANSGRASSWAWCSTSSIGEPKFDRKKLRPIAAIVDDVPVLPLELLAFLRELASYYLSPIGEVLRMALPALERTQVRALLEHDDKGTSVRGQEGGGRLVTMVKLASGGGDAAGLQREAPRACRPRFSSTWSVPRDVGPSARTAVERRARRRQKAGRVWGSSN